MATPAPEFAEDGSTSKPPGTKSRIDFVFAQKNGPSMPAVSSVDTVSYAQVRTAAGDGCGLDHSGHRAIRAFISC